MSNPAVPFKTAALLAPLLAGVLALHAWGDPAADRVARSVDLWQYPEISRPPFVLRFPRGSDAERGAIEPGCGIPNAVRSRYRPSERLGYGVIGHGRPSRGEGIDSPPQVGCHLPEQPLEAFGRLCLRLFPVGIGAAHRRHTI